MEINYYVKNYTNLLVLFALIIFPIHTFAKSFIDDTIHFYDFYLNVYEYLDYSNYDYSKYNKKIPAWLNVQPQPVKSLKEIDELGLDAYTFNGLDYSLN